MISVLVVDDEAPMLDLTQAYLEEDQGISVTPCTTAREALIHLGTSRYDAIISDYEMPGMDGISLLKDVRDADTSIPFIVFTGRGREEVVIDALNNGADFYLQKTGDPATVFAELRHILYQVVARSRSEASLRESERRLSTLMGNLPGMAYRCRNDPAHTMEFVSDGCRTLTGYAADEIVENRVTSYGELIHPDDRDFVRETIRDALHDDGPFTFEYRIRTMNGASRWVWEQGRGVFDSGGRVIALEGFIADITERKEAGNALQESEEKLRMLFDNATDMIFINGLDERRLPTHFTEVNRMVTRKLGFTRDELLRMTSFDITAPESLKTAHAIAEGFRTRDEGTYELVFRTIDRIPIPVEVSFRQLKIRGDRVIFSIARDITERKQTENALQESESRFRTIFDEGPLGMAIAGPDLRYLMVNPTFAAMLGSTPGELVRKGMHEQIAPGHYARDIAQLKRLQRGEIDTYRTESSFARDEEGIIWISATVSTIRDRDGRLIYYITMAEDITERKSADAAVSESEEMFRSIVESAPSFLQIVDREGKNIYVSPNCEMITGYPAEELLGPMKWWVHPDDLDRVQRIFDESTRTGAGVRQFEYKAQKPDGSVWYASSSWEMMKGPGSTIRGVVVQTIDITQRRIADRALAASEERFRRMAENVHDGLVIIEAGEVVYVNARAVEIFGYPEDELRRIDWRSLIAPEEQERTEAFSGIIAAEGAAPDELEFWIVRKDGTRRYVHTRYSQVEEKGSVVARYVAVTDITPRRQDEEALKQANANLNLMNSVTRHDVLNQLGILEASLEIAHGMNLDGGILDNISRMEKAAGAIRRQIEFTRDYQDIGSGAPQWQRVGEVFMKAAKSFDLENIELSVDCEGIEISADPMLEKVFHNLIDNTIAHARGARTILLGCETERGGLRIVYEDDGPGIPAGEKERIFQRGVGKKTGYGLCIIRTILGITGISICETGLSGKGARFAMHVPRGRYRTVDNAS
jgi:PAS domain S-box-containing protein